MRIVNGQLVLDETSVQVDRRERDMGADGPLEVIEESNLTRRVNSATWSKREKTERWDDEETDRFYEALGMFGTDFEMMSKMFAGRSRRMLKNKEDHEKELEVTAAANSALTRERNEAAIAELEREANGEAGADGDKGDKLALKRAKKGKQKYMSRQGGDDEAVVVGTVDDFHFLRP
ncbi:hypothetical protein DRE_05181 [Drechslerella stenobrocha 248]|uniref:Myb-like domain-containing protein n=1 Tax=Drechslerella stenobrocha 248 TaxID=1043628 RepID=W7I9A9_9PEZI|nr:hypothetical protein DRE_05181 [Drechslerella stenobrocha 248]